MKFDLDIAFDYEIALDDASSQSHIRQMLAIIFQLVYKIHHQETYGKNWLRDFLTLFYFENDLYIIKFLIKFLFRLKVKIKTFIHVKEF